MAAFLTAALVERGHGLVGAPRLDLHEKGPPVVALGAGGLGRVDVLPGRRSAEHVVHLLEFGERLVADLVLHVLDVGARRTREPQAVGTFLHTEDVGASRAEH